MNSKNLKEAAFYVLIFAAWFLSGLRKVISVETAVLFIAFAVSGAVYFLLKDVKLKSIIIALITVGAGIYTYEYALFYVPVLLLLIMYDCADKNKQEKTYETCTTVLIALMLFKIAYTVFIRIDNGRYLNGNLTTYFKAAGFIIIFFALVLTVCKKEDSKNRKKQSKSFNVYILSFIGIFQDVILIAVKNINGEIQSARFDFMAWFAFMLIIMYFNGNSVKTLIKGANGGLEKFLDIRG